MAQQLLENYSKFLSTVPYSSTGLLSSLPSPPHGKTGWPWTEETSPLPPTLLDGKQYPKITIVTPSFNQGQFIEETIRSVLLQNYPNLEYIIMDGGSTDNTVSILEKYTNWISVWRSEKDNGQTHAINKGFEYASGFIRGYLNSDDLLLPKALEQIAGIGTAYLEQPILILGNCAMDGSPEKILKINTPVLPESFIDAVSKDGLCPQPATFWTQPENSALQCFNEQLVFCMDYDFWCRLIETRYQLVKLDATLAYYRHHPEAKGARITDVFWSELAGLPLLNLAKVESLAEKMKLVAISRRRVRHYLRLEIQKVFVNHGKWAALKSLVKVCLQEPSLLFERSTLGLARKLLSTTLK